MPKPLGYFIEALQRRCGSVLGSTAKALDRDYAQKLLIAALRQVLPILPNTLLDDYTLKLTAFMLPAGGSGPLSQPVASLPPDLLDLRGVDAAIPGATVRLFYSWNEFQAAKSQMGNWRLEEYLFIQQGKKLCWWPILRSPKPILISYVCWPKEPQSYTEPFYCPDAAEDLVINKAASMFNTGDIRPDQVRTLEELWNKSLSLLIELHKAKRSDDPFLIKVGMIQSGGNE